MILPSSRWTPPKPSLPSRLSPSATISDVRPASPRIAPSRTGRRYSPTRSMPSASLQGDGATSLQGHGAGGETQRSGLTMPETAERVEGFRSRSRSDRRRGSFTPGDGATRVSVRGSRFSHLEMNPDRPEARVMVPFGTSGNADPVTTGAEGEPRREHPRRGHRVQRRRRLRGFTGGLLRGGADSFVSESSCGFNRGRYDSTSTTKS